MNKIKLKVYARMFDGTSYMGYIYLDEDQRIQDLLNDERKFIPICRIAQQRGAIAVKDKEECVDVCLHKDGIYYMEEL